MMYNSSTTSSNCKSHQNLKSTSNTQSYDQKLDNQFVRILTFIEQRYVRFNRHIQIRIEKWVEKLLLYDQNTTFRKRRNKYMHLLLEMIERQYISFMFLKMPPDQIPNITDSQYKLMIQEIKKRKKVQVVKHREIQQKKIDQPQGDSGTCQATPCQTDRDQIHIDRSQQIQHHLMSGQRQTTRNKLQQLNINCRDQNKIHDKQSIEANLSKIKSQFELSDEDDLINRLEQLLNRNCDRLQNTQNCYELLNALRCSSNDKKSRINDTGSKKKLNNLGGWQKEQKKVCSKQITYHTQNQDESGQLRIEQGTHQINLSDLGSPRQTAMQMQYFRGNIEL